MPQPLQLSGSKSVSAHEAPPPQIEAGGVQAPRHWLWLHSVPIAHGWLQPPQWKRSVAIATHSPLQGCCPTSHGGLHWPWTQGAFAGHGRPHVPQLRTSFIRSTQRPAQRLVAPLQITPH